MFLSRKFVNTRSTKALRDYFALPERPPTSATLIYCDIIYYALYPLVKSVMCVFFPQFLPQRSLLVGVVASFNLLSFVFNLFLLLNNINRITCLSEFLSAGKLRCANLFLPLSLLLPSLPYLIFVIFFPKYNFWLHFFLHKSA